jgi:hypothetical protein
VPVLFFILFTNSPQKKPAPFKYKPVIILRSNVLPPLAQASTEVSNARATPAQPPNNIRASPDRTRPPADRSPNAQSIQRTRSNPMRPRIRQIWPIFHIFHLIFKNFP